MSIVVAALLKKQNGVREVAPGRYSIVARVLPCRAGRCKRGVAKVGWFVRDLVSLTHLYQ